MGLLVQPGHSLEIWLDGCLRKRRGIGVGTVIHVWTNVELHWEEHRLVEARYNLSSSRLVVTVNGTTVLQAQVAPKPRRRRDLAGSGAASV